MAFKESRKQRIFNELYRLGPLSNQELADSFELSPASITQFLKPCIGSGQLSAISADDFPLNREIGVSETGRKRRKATVFPNPDYGYFLCVEITCDSLCFRKIDFTLRCLPDEPFSMAIGSDSDFIDEVSEAILRISRSDPRRLLAVGLTVSGRPDPHTGILSFSHDSLVPPGMDAAGLVALRTGFPCVMENDANALALFERYCGKARNSEHFMCLYINEGVGIGIFANGRLYEGWQNQAGESGHWIIDPSGPQLPGIPRGSFESYVSAPALQLQLAAIGMATSEREAWAALAAGSAGPGNLPFDRFPELAAIQEAIIGHTALLCVNLFHIFAPEHIFIYGPLTARSLDLHDRLMRKALQLANPDRAGDFEKVLISRSDWQTAMALGTAKTALDHIL